MRSLALALLLMGACTKADPPPAAPPPPPPPLPVLAADGLPSHATARDLVMGPCQICHSSDYVKQQRLTGAQWSATVKKMVGWGAPLTEAQVTTLAEVLAEAYPPSLPDPQYESVNP